MRRVSRRSLVAHKVRLVLTVISVVLGTAFVAGSFVFTDTLKHTFNGIFSDADKGVDVRVDAKKDSNPGVPLTLADRIKTVPGVRAVQLETSAPLVLIGTNGKRVSSGGVEFTKQQGLQLFTDGTHVDAVSIAGADGVSEKALRDRVAALLPNDLRAKTGDQVRKDDRDAVASALSFVNIFL